MSEYKFVAPNSSKKISLAEHEALKAKQAKKSFNIPRPLQFILATPLVIFFCFGIILVPMMLFSVISHWGDKSNWKNDYHPDLPEKASVSSTSSSASTQ